MKINKAILYGGVLALVFGGCSSKRYFEPEHTYSVSHAKRSIGGKIVDLTREGATLHDGRFIGVSGKSAFDLGEGYRYLGENEKYVLAGNDEGVLKIIDKQSGEPLRAVALHVPIVSAAIGNGLIVYVLNNNTFGVYEIESNRKLVESRSERTLAVDTRAASPMFVGGLVVIPTLDGKLIIVDPYDSENAKAVYISNEAYFNNVIFLRRMGDFLVAATPKKVVLIGNGAKKEYKADISEIAVGNGAIYLFTKEGEIVKLDMNLHPTAKQKFKFAHFATASAFDGKVYALDQKGSLIVLSADLARYKIYDVGDVDNPPLMSHKELYKEGDVILLDRLGYE